MAHTPGPWTHDGGDPHMMAGDPDTMFESYYIFDAKGNCVAIVPDDPYLGLSVLDNVKLLAAAPRLLAAPELIRRIANLENGEVSQEEWDEYIAPFARHNYASMMAILDAIQAIAHVASQAARGEEK